MGESPRSREDLPRAHDPGVMLRPEATILGDESLVPEANIVRPAPNRFTHELSVDEPYRFDEGGESAEPDGVVPAGTPAVLLVEGPDRSRVVVQGGLYIEVRTASLRKLPVT